MTACLCFSYIHFMYAFSLSPSNIRSIKEWDPWMTLAIVQKRFALAINITELKMMDITSHI